MKAFELETGLILKERNRFIDREANTLTLIFAVKIKYGTTNTEELARKETVIQVDITDSRNPVTWDEIKDIDNTDLFSYLLANKDFVYLQDDATRTEENEAEFQRLAPFYNSIFPYLNAYDGITTIDI